MVTHLTFNFCGVLFVCSLPGPGRHQASGVPVCTSGSPPPGSYLNLAGKSVGGRVPGAACRRPGLRLGHLLRPAGEPELHPGPSVAAAPTQPLAGVWTRQLAQPALPRVPTGRSAAGGGAPLPARCHDSRLLATRWRAAALSQAAGAALLPNFVDQLERMTT